MSIDKTNQPLEQTSSNSEQPLSLKEKLSLKKDNFSQSMAVRKERKRIAKDALKSAPLPAVTLKDWYTAFLCMNVPFFGWIYLIVLSRSKKCPEIQPFAKAYLLFKLTFLLISLVALIVIILVGLEAMDQLLSYMDML